MYNEILSIQSADYHYSHFRGTVKKDSWLGNHVSLKTESGVSLTLSAGGQLIYTGG